MKTIAGFDARVLREFGNVRRIAPEWAQLWQRCRGATTFQRPEWLLPWIEVFSPHGMVAIEVRHHGRMVGFAPLLIYPRETEHVLAFMGGGVSDYLDVLADPDCELHVIESMLKAIKGVANWTRLELTDLPPDSVLLKWSMSGHIPGQAASQHDVCSALTLPRTRTELLHLFSKRQRANLRNARARLQKAGGGQVEVVTAETLVEFLEDLFRLHTSRWVQVGQIGVLQDHAIKAFHLASAPDLLGRGILRLHRLRVSGRTIAAIYSLFERDTVFCYLQGFDPEFADLSPGTHLMFSVMEDAVERGITKFDFLRGQEAYKQHWRAQRNPTYRIQFPFTALSSDGPSGRSAPIDARAA
jgi:CelD/BcsL family acetyltransferase involved in cellulose biosynthesis